MSRSIRVNTNKAISENDQFVSRLRDRIRSLDRTTHSLVLGRLHQIHESFNEEILEESLDLGLVDPLDALSSLIGSACGIALLNEIALERWGPNGTEADQ